MSFERNAEVDRIRKRIDHPVIDGDGHLIEYTPVVRDFLVEEAGEEAAKRFDGIIHGSELARKIPLDQKRSVGYSRTAWELVEDGHIDEEAFVCGNALSLWTSTNPNFFEGTAVEDAASNR